MLGSEEPGEYLDLNPSAACMIGSRRAPPKRGGQCPSSRKGEHSIPGSKSNKQQMCMLQE